LRTLESKRGQDTEGSEGAKDRRREVPRIELSQAAYLITQDGRSISVEFLDLSCQGFKIRHSDDLLEGDLVTIVSARGSKAPGEIKWVADQMAGGIFVEPPPAVSA
jgi:hypothetical protein